MHRDLIRCYLESKKIVTKEVNMKSFRNYGEVNVMLSSRKRTLLRRALQNLGENVSKRPASYSKKYGIESKSTINTHKRDIESLFVDFNL